MKTEESEALDSPRWCPEQQIYIGGVVPNHSSEADDLLKSNNGTLRLFGYGSLCWNPGQDAILSHPSVVPSLGRAVGWKRCWAQRSADHRGTPSFPGLVCTLLSDEEYEGIRASYYYKSVDIIAEKKDDEATLTEGVIYTVPASLAQECLAELDFREKGGYSRDVIQVIDDKSGELVKALLYRGTPDNPAFWRRALVDLPFAAAIMSVAIGPSGPNDAYLYNLDSNLANATTTLCSGDIDTRALANMCKELQKHSLYFFFGSGSNQYKQILSADVQEDYHELSEAVLVVPPNHHQINGFPKRKSKPVHLYAGGGHSALLTDNGNLFLWGWNEKGQLGHWHSSTSNSEKDHDLPYPLTEPLDNILVEKASLGHAHTLILERDTGFVYAFGDNTRGQVTGTIDADNTAIMEPIMPLMLQEVQCVDVAAGVFHSAVVTVSGELITFGYSRYGQSLAPNDMGGAVWKPSDGSRIVKVACGWRHTIALDEHGRVWTMGDNKYGQLGRDNMGNENIISELCKSGEKMMLTVPRLVSGTLSEKGSGCIEVHCGWSHNVALVRRDGASSSETLVYGWGRNDKGQLGIMESDAISKPICIDLPDGRKTAKVSCGAESSAVLCNNGIILTCGWNEHGNLSTGNTVDSHRYSKVIGAKVMKPPSSGDDNSDVLIACGGAHLLAMMS